jgi:hypothetical protein
VSPFEGKPGGEGPLGCLTGSDGVFPSWPHRHPATAIAKPVKGSQTRGVVEQVPPPGVLRGLLRGVHGAVLHAEHGRGGLLLPARQGAPPTGTPCPPPDHEMNSCLVILPQCVDRDGRPFDTSLTMRLFISDSGNQTATCIEVGPAATAAPAAWGGGWPLGQPEAYPASPPAPAYSYGGMDSLSSSTWSPCPSIVESRSSSPRSDATAATDELYAVMPPAAASTWSSSCSSSMSAGSHSFSSGSETGTDASGGWPAGAAGISDSSWTTTTPGGSGYSYPAPDLAAVAMAAGQQYGSATCEALEMMGWPHQAADAMAQAEWCQDGRGVDPEDYVLESMEFADIQLGMD